MALAYPGVHFRLAHDDRIIADYAAVGDGKDRLHQVLGRGIAKDLIPFAWAREELTVGGYLSSAPVSFPNSLPYDVCQSPLRPRQSGDACGSSRLRDFIDEGPVSYGYSLSGNSICRSGCDVHPAKFEVRFRRQSEVHEAVADAIRQALKQEAKNPLVRTRAPRPRLLPG